MADYLPHDTTRIAPHLSFAEETAALARDVRRPFLGRIRFQLGGALIIGILLPLLLRWPIVAFKLEFITSAMMMPSIAASALAIVIGYGLVRQFIAYPGVQATAYILPSLTASFAAAALFMFFLRIDYSRYIILSSLVLSVVWLYVAFFLRNRFALPLLALVPGGNLRGATGIAGARWYELASPQQRLRNVDAVVVDLDADLLPDWERFIAKCTLAGIPVYHVRSVIESLTGRVQVEHLSENSFGTVLPSSLYLRLKRMSDVLLALLFLLPAMIVITIAALAIAIESRGPVIFSQPRMGFRGHVFTVFKLRTMRTDIIEDRHFTEDNDPRITKVGRFLRKYRIDELPQIFNILKGEMSWIGPRPEAIQLAEWYASEIPFYVYRHAVWPGISGWAQVSQGNVAEIDSARIKLEYDFYYIKNFSGWLDVLILLKTIKTIFTGFGSK